MIKRAYWILLLLLVPPWAGALGLQGISVASFIDQPLDARIDITSLNGVGIEDLHAELAAAAEFQQVGLERPRTLSELRFEPIQGEDGRAYVRVTSRSPIREPSLDFLVRLRWSGGSLLKEFAILLDPPAYRPVVAGKTAGRDGKDPASSTVARAQWQTYGPVRNSETLWVIAEKVRADRDVSVEQMMMALQRANPGAFNRGNVNLLRQGAVLEIPDRAFVSKLSRRQARAMFRQQTSVWRALRSRPVEKRDASTAVGDSGTVGTVAADKPGSRPAAAGGTDEGRLRVVESGAEWQSPVAEASAPQQAEEQESLKQAIEESRNDLAAVRAINRDLQTLSQVLESRIEALRGVLEEKEQVIDGLKAQLEQKPVPAAREPDGGQGTGVAREQQERPGGISSEISVITEKKVEPPAAGVNPMAADAATIIAWLRAYWMPLAGLVLLLLLVLLVLLVRRKDRVSKMPDPDAFSSYMDMEDTRILEQGAGNTHNGEQAQEGLAGGRKDDEDGMLPGQRTDVTSVLTEVDIYLAYRRYSQAEMLIKEAIRQHPENWVLKAKLLEIFAFRKDRKRFTHFMEEVQPEMSVEAPEIWSKVVEMGRGLIPTHPLIVDAQLPEEIAWEEFGGGDMEVPPDGLDIPDQEEKYTQASDAGKGDRPDRKR